MNEKRGNKRAENEIGNRYGRLVVIDQFMSRKYGRSDTWFLCKCDCGKEKEFLRRNVVKNENPTISCGCYSESKRNNRLNDLKGMTFGRLTVLERAGSSKNGTAMWKCICSCPSKNEVIVKGTSLKSGSSSSCGCWRSDCRKGELNYRWKGGDETPFYDFYNDKISFCEETRRHLADERILQVKCTNINCAMWFTPTSNELSNRISSIVGMTSAENRFYCSDECKKSCSIFRQRLFPKGFKSESNRPYVDSYWTEEVLRQADYQCEICGSRDNLTAHHIKTATLNPILANDIDNGICLCRSCHYSKAHTGDGCKTIDLRCKQ